jgi:8-oxo-dGTP pyrophosphatase MutT (NUDIX family)
MRTVDTVALIVMEGDRLLVERRKRDKATDPGVVVVPGGHVEEGESLVDACARELKEELDLDCTRFRFIDQMLWGTSIENQKVHFFVCEGWRGMPRSNEAAEVFFIGIDELCLISIEKERVLLEKHLKK